MQRFEERAVERFLAPAEREALERVLAFRPSVERPQPIVDGLGVGARFGEQERVGVAWS